MKKPTPRNGDILPKYVKLSGGRYVYRPYIPAKQRGNFPTDKFGYLKPPIRLGSKTDPIHRIYAAYAAAEEQLRHQREPDYLTLNWLYQQYTKSRSFLECEPETQRRYRTCQKILTHPMKIDGKDSVLGDLLATHLKTTTVRRLLDRRLEQYQAAAKDGASQCNNEKALLSAMYTHGIQYIDELSSLKNPCHGVTKFKVAVRERYVTDEEYATVYQFAHAHCPAYIPIAMELTYLLAARGIEATDLTLTSATPDGITVHRKKGSKTTIIRWTPRLRAAWDAAAARHKPDAPPTTKLLKKQRGGGGITRSGLSSAWQNLKKDMEAAGLGEIYFWLHDLKRKGISDADDDRIAGHVSDTTRANYNVKHQQFDPPK